MYLNNGLVDQGFSLSAGRHFDDEAFQGGRDIITAGTSKFDNIGQKTINIIVL